MRLGAIGDDFTGSSDLANMLRRGGMRVVQYVGTPEAPAGADVEAGVVSLKSRTLPGAEAVSQSLAAAHWLLAQGAEQLYFKYCSTFDSTPQGNIGPVIDALMDLVNANGVVVCPAFPETGRSVFQGHLFVGDRLLHESGMQNHPLTPMTDPDLRRWLTPQTRHPVGLVPHATVAQGPEAIATALEDQAIAVVDAVDNDALLTIGAAVKGAKLVTGGSGLALGLPQNFDGLAGAGADPWAGLSGPGVVLSGSCSSATLGQVERYLAAGHPGFRLEPDAVMAGEVSPDQLAAFAMASEAPALIYASDTPEAVRAAQAKHGRDALAHAIDTLFTQTTRALVSAGIRRIVSAGGETSGAVVAGLDAIALEVGPQIAPGVPALKVGGQEIVVALKSGNFGGPDFFAEALEVLGDV
ncbi:MAG: 3-oxo-tetronate kinase [Pseudomonadota bacterium]